jgi:hypothetical protein
MAMGSACVRYFHLYIMYRMQHYGLVEAMVRCPPATAICFYFLFCFTSGNCYLCYGRLPYYLENKPQWLIFQTMRCSNPRLRVIYGDPCSHCRPGPRLRNSLKGHDYAHQDPSPAETASELNLSLPGPGASCRLRGRTCFARRLDGLRRFR